MNQFVAEDDYVAVPFMGGHYMCVRNSPRAESLQRANRAWVMGYDDLANDLLAEALSRPGCAFEHREIVATGDLTLDIEALRDQNE